MKDYHLILDTEPFAILDDSPRGGKGGKSRKGKKPIPKILMDLIKNHKPKVVVFVYKRVLDNMLKLKFGIHKKASYGLNPQLLPVLGAHLFSSPRPELEVARESRPLRQ